MRTLNGKEIMVKYFDEYYNLYDWLMENKQYEMVKYQFTFAYGYILYYVKK